MVSAGGEQLCGDQITLKQATESCKLSEHAQFQSHFV